MIFWVTSSTHPSTPQGFWSAPVPNRSQNTLAWGQEGLESLWLGDISGVFGSKWLCQQAPRLLLPTRIPCPGLLACLPQPWTLASISSAFLSLPWWWQASNHCLSSAALHCSCWDSSPLSLLTSQLCQLIFKSLPKPTRTVAPVNLLYSLLP